MNYNLLFIFVSLMCCLVSCSKEEVDAVNGDRKGQITVLFLPNGLGDMGYNDQIMCGIMRFYEAHEVSMNLVRPNNTEEASQALHKWQTETKDKGKSLLVLADSEYEKLVTTSSLNLSKNQQILLFETMNQNLPEGVNSFHINRYGASYLAGCMAKEHEAATIVAAMPGEPMLQESIQGFTDGYQGHSDKLVELVFLSDSDEGFSMEDDAYRVASEIGNAFIFPLAGGSNNGIYKYSRETDFYLSLIVGMDTDCSMYSDRIPFSMVIHIDKVVEQYLTDWLNDLSLEHNQTFGLESGVIDIALSPVFYRNLNIWEEYYMDNGYWENAYQSHKVEAIGKEKEYGKN